MYSYESIKSSIRLLLTSASNGLTLEQLNNDYKYYNHSQNIPYKNFGYSQLFDFLCDMPDIVQFDENSSSSIIYGVKKIKTIIINKYSAKSNNKNLLLNKCKSSSKNIKRLALKNLSNNHSTDHITNQLTNLTMNQQNSLINVSENISSYEIIKISINSINKCEIIRYSNRKFYITCFELSRILNIDEDVIDKETMFSRIRIYQSNNLYKDINNYCTHTKHSHRPYFFLFLISSIIPVLKMPNNINQYYDIVLAFEQLLTI